MFKDLDPILHSQLRLAVISLLVSVKEAEFTYLKEQSASTAGNLSVQIQKLKDAGYIEVEKKFKDKFTEEAAHFDIFKRFKIPKYFYVLI